ncbi:lactate utilization protein [Geobacter sp. SVR]|uniref:LutC/YkgG family protein n=1 Tax=Geobacter sp. SVR TaxID=2495594 RepID=UPI00143EFA67|nr:lactate utilization protein [Geobacter sp. SVR]BCS52616.1 hypothetical protein GSVR_09240 [Geobacter sp. SVR]GCF83946.1 hypothetical protein GSbR_05460 [Geobacter sp. SVR]
MLFQQFKTRAEGVGAEVHRFKTREEALEFILHFLPSAGVAAAPGSFAAWAEGPFLEGLDRTRLTSCVPGLRFDVDRELAADALVGISDMDWALADTGSLVADQSGAAQRLVSTLATIHIALISTARVLPDKNALFTRITPATSRYIAFITGPSRTADIERVLTIGVHGPKRLVIVCADETEGAEQ